MIIRDNTFNTFPSIIHSPQPNLLDEIAELLFRELPQKKVTNNLTIITWNTSEKSILEKSLDHFSLKYKALRGLNELEEMRLLIEYLPTVTNDIVICANRNSIIINDPQKIIDKFLKTKLKMCYIGCPFGSFTSSSKIEDDLYRENKIRHLNKEIFIGYTKFVKDFLTTSRQIIPVFKSRTKHLNKEIISKKKTNFEETEILKIAATLFYPYVGIDHECNMFDYITCKDKLTINPKIAFVDKKISKCFFK